jgi:hypothetical protein
MDKDKRRQAFREMLRGWTQEEEDAARARVMAGMAGKPLTKAEREQCFEMLDKLSSALEHMQCMLLDVRDSEFVSATWTDIFLGKFPAIREQYAALDALLGTTD